ncbi:NADH-quinone oxidoreductase subunit E [Roseinatronobacter sp. NSM]|uniref:NADH-quinone oxidoreductase subunit E n=1 Tax=Roseinatronobacter sp. NSM TaxID=3457785 RepID=UPI0040371A84
MLRRLHPDQPASFAFTPANQAWAQAQITKYPEGRQASAIIPLLWRAQEQEGWLTRPAIEHIAEMLGMAYIRALEVATFYFMFQLQPVGSVAHFQVCGTLSCMICGAEKLIEVCKQKIAPRAHMLSADGKFSWEEVECLGACSNAPMVQIGKDYYEDLTAEGFAQLIDDLAAGKVPTAGPQNGRFSSEPLGGATSLQDYTGEAQNGSVALATRIGDTIKRIDGTEVPLLTPWQDKPAAANAVTPGTIKEHEPKPAISTPVDKTGVSKQEAQATPKAKPGADPKAAETAQPAPQMLTAPQGTADDLKLLKGVGPKLEGVLNDLGVFHFWQVAVWTPDDVAWVDDRLKFKGRIERDGWIEQARILANGGETEFSKRAK